MASEQTEERVIRITEAARMLSVHANTIRNAIKKGKLPAEKRPGKWGRDEYAILLSDLEAFCLQQYGKPLADAEELAEQRQPQQEDQSVLYERIIELQEQLTQTKAICAVNESMESQFKDQIAQLVHERNAANERVLALTEELAEEKNRKGWFRRLF